MTQILSFSNVDECIEKKDLSAIFSEPVDYADFAKITLYLRGLSNVNAELAPSLSNVGYYMSLMQGALPQALNYAVSRNNWHEVKEVFSIAADYSTKSHTSIAHPINIGETVQLTNEKRADAWSPVSLVNYDGTDTPQFRFAMLVQLSYNIQECGYVFSTSELMEVLNESDVFEASGFEFAAEKIESVLRGETVFQLQQYMVENQDMGASKSVSDIHASDSKRKNHVLDSTFTGVVEAVTTGFVHAGYGNDDLLTLNDQASIGTARTHSLVSSIASLGLIMRGDVERVLQHLDRYQFIADNYSRAGTALALGLGCGQVDSEFQPVLSMNQESLLSENLLERQCALQAMGMAYIGTGCEEFDDELCLSIADRDIGWETNAAAALAAGWVYAGTANMVIAEPIIAAIQDASEIAPNSLKGEFAGDWPKFTAVNPVIYELALALALLFLNTGERYTKDFEGEVTEMLSGLEHPVAEFARTLCYYFAMIGCGDIIQFQATMLKMVDKVHDIQNIDVEADERELEAAENGTAPPAPAVSGSTGGSSNPLGFDTSMLNELVGDAKNEKVEDVIEGAGVESEPKSEADAVNVNYISKEAKAVADELENSIPGLYLISMALMTMHDQALSDMFLRFCVLAIQYDSLFVRRAIPLALAVHYVSKPWPQVVDILGRLARDADADVALHAIVSLGIVSLGTNNARVSGILKSLGDGYHNEVEAVSVVRMAQGLLHAGKGLLTASPLHNHSRIMNDSGPVVINMKRLVPLLTFIVQSLFAKNNVCTVDKSLNIFHLAAAMGPRYTITLDASTNFDPVAIPVTVGARVDCAGRVGIQRTSGARKMDTPLILSPDESIEMANYVYQPMDCSGSGVIVVRKMGKEWSRVAEKNLN